MIRTGLAIAFVLFASVLFGQKKTTTSAVVNFDATTSLDHLPKANNKAVVALIDTKSGNVAFEVTIKNFSFYNPLMQEQFNSSKYMNSDQFPTATFKGKITNMSDVKFNTNGTYTAMVEGLLTIHGVSNSFATTASVVVNGKKIRVVSDFTIRITDYKISGPAIMIGKVSKEPKIHVQADFQ